MYKILLIIYFNSPVWLQNIIISIRGYQIKRIRFSKTFFKQLNFYQNFYLKPIEEQQQLEEERLRSFLKKAKQSEFWDIKFKEYNLNLEADDIVEQLRKLPILTKEEVKKNIETIKINSNNLVSVKTSGTTGGGLKFYETKESECERWSIWWNYRLYHNIKLDQWYGWFGGMKIIKTKTQKKPYWRINYPEKRVMFSPYHLNQDTIEDYVSEIISRKLTWLHGYPSQLAFLSSLCLNKDHDFSFVKNITLGGENFLENQRFLISKVFPNAKVTQHYGLAESVSNISEKTNGQLSFDKYFSYNEIVKTKIKNKFWIIGTNLSNPNFPLIRYNTNDVVEVINGKIISIDGRKEDYVTLRDGSKLGRLDHVFKGLVHIKEAQIFQKDKDLLIFKIVKGDCYDEKNEEENLIYEINSRFKNKINFKIMYVKKIDRTKSGKLRFVISNIKE